HEIGHAYELSDAYDYPSRGICKIPPALASEKVNGYWVEQTYPIVDASPLMFGAEGVEFPYASRWIPANEYRHIFTKYKENVFSDVSDSYWASQHVERLYNA